MAAHPRSAEQHGTTVFLTTHYLEEADRYAERVMVMDKGRVIADDTATRLKAHLAGDVLTFGFASARDAAAAAAAIERFDVPPRHRRRRLTSRRPRRRCSPLLRALDAGHPATLRPPTLDDVFLALTGRTLREDARPEAISEDDEGPERREPTTIRDHQGRGAA